MRACIAGWGVALPEQRVTNAELERRVDTSDEWIVERTGIRERRYSGEGDTTASLAIAAGAAAIKQAGLHPDAIDLL
ncbi:MAG TPA: 3-oxoacyl-ACP synthase, partial [Acidimicrobiia bacterium]|nr:3-oxoacyl-ACP synthase [Acidimicrobiia bacterium]